MFSSRSLLKTVLSSERWLPQPMLNQRRSLYTGSVHERRRTWENGFATVVAWIKKKVFISKMKKNTIYLQFNDVYRTDWKEEILLLRFSRSLWQRNDAIPLKKKKKKKKKKREEAESHYSIVIPSSQCVFLVTHAFVTVLWRHDDPNPMCSAEFQQRQMRPTMTFESERSTVSSVVMSSGHTLLPQCTHLI